uniref:Enoyl-CoA delta isomerase 2, mitochondrial n=1 Tax=Panagrolaimus sp. PS1159 TaxID=55785 RepID=A0AC35F7S8_9BILA
MSDQEILVEKRGKSWWITFNRPKRRNAINTNSYVILNTALKKINEDDSTLFTVFTGVGDFFTSGNDFAPEEMSKAADQSVLGYELLVHGLIDHKKPVIALVNGPAIGIGCTILTLMDYVVAAEHAYFLCPFTSMGLSPEGCSSKTFESLMGYQNAARLALFSEKMTAQEALRKLLKGEKWRKEMHAISHREKEFLSVRMESDEAMERLMAKFGSKSKI